MNFKETIVALATPAGLGALAVVRISGAEAFEIFQKLSPKINLKTKLSHSAFLAKIYTDEGEILDEALVILFQNPKSFTGENVVEISLHGSPYIMHECIKLCLNYGGRLARPGEFSQRAFINGKLDLAQAEAIGDLIASESKASHRAAFRQLKGNLSKAIYELRQELIDFTALIELELDFGEEDVEFADRTKLLELIGRIQNQIETLTQSFSTGQAVKNGIPIIIVGPPNAGKSTLLNALLEEEKAIVSPIAGTTRDVIEDQLIIHGVQYRFLDTAGLRVTEDVVESIGIERTMAQLERASLALLLQAPENSNAEIEAIELQIKERNVPYFNIRTKADLATELDGKAFNLSAKTGLGLTDLKDRIFTSTVEKEMLETETPLITNLRHFEALTSAGKALEQVKAGIHSQLSGDLLATDIREALFYLGSITGEISVEEVLGSIFSKFCIGK